MAIIRSLAIGKARKSAGNLTFSTINGRTIAREKPAFISNPKTPKQLEQRSKMRNVVAAYRAVGYQVKDFFTIVPKYGSKYNQFVKSNIGMAENFVVDELTQEVTNLEGLVVANGTYPPFQNVNIEVAEGDLNMDFAPEDWKIPLKEGDILAAVVINPDNQQVQVSTKTLSASEASSIPTLGYFTIPVGLDAASMGCVIYYSPSENKSTSAYIKSFV